MLQQFNFSSFNKSYELPISIDLNKIESFYRNGILKVILPKRKEYHKQAKKNISVKTKYCEGWEDGYCEGWKDVKGQYAICPITPICPIPEIGQDNYRGGYNRGFKAGSRAAYRN